MGFLSGSIVSARWAVQADNCPCRRGRKSASLTVMSSYGSRGSDGSMLIVNYNERRGIRRISLTLYAVKWFSNDVFGASVTDVIDSFSTSVPDHKSMRWVYDTMNSLGRDFWNNSLNWVVSDVASIIGGTNKTEYLSLCNSRWSRSSIRKMLGVLGENV